MKTAQRKRTNNAVLLVLNRIPRLRAECYSVQVNQGTGAMSTRGRDHQPLCSIRLDWACRCLLQL